MSTLSAKVNWDNAFRRIRRSIEGGLANDYTAASKFVDRSVWGSSSPVYLSTHEGPGTMNMVGLYGYTKYGEGVYS